LTQTYSVIKSDAKYKLLTKNLQRKKGLVNKTRIKSLNLDKREMKYTVQF